MSVDDSAFLVYLAEIEKAGYGPTDEYIKNLMASFDKYVVTEWDGVGSDGLRKMGLPQLADLLDSLFDGVHPEQL